MPVAAARQPSLERRDETHCGARKAETFQVDGVEQRTELGLVAAPDEDQVMPRDQTTEKLVVPGLKRVPRCLVECPVCLVPSRSAVKKNRNPAGFRPP